MKYLLLALIFSHSLMADELQTIEVSDHLNESPLEHYGHSAKTLHTRELKKRREVSLGDTLKNEAGVTSNSFGPNAGRPVIRGLDGDRIKILQNGLGVLDASAQSADHAVPVDTLIVDSIEIVRGPLAMLYGSSAVGGVVNVTTNRIHSNFEEGSVKEIQIQGDTATNGVSTGAKLDFGKNDWMFHLDAGFRNSNDQQIPNYQVSRRARDRDPTASTHKNDIENSASTQKQAAAGVSRIFSKGHVGVSYYFFDNYYGVVAEEDVKIKMIQNRVELHAEYRPEGEYLRAIRLKSAQSDYGHKELAGGEVGTTFANEGNESRLEFLTKMGDVRGVSGVQTQMFNFSAVGEEAFLPATRNSNLSGFTLQEIIQGQNTYTLGARFESTHVHNQESKDQSNFNTISGAAGYSYKFTKEFSSSLNFSLTERAPNFQELYANGPHVAVGIFEEGDKDLKTEKAYAIDWGLKYNHGQDSVQLNFYAQKFDNYIALSPTDREDGEPGEELPVSVYEQVDAVFYGADFEARDQIQNSTYTLVYRGDIVRAKNTDSGDNLPRISPPRVSVGLEKVIDRWIMDVEAQYNFEQHKISENELRTDDFTLVNLGVTYDMPIGEKNFSSFVRLRNLLNQEARIHSSTLKEIAPLPGRNVVAGVQYLF